MLPLGIKEVSKIIKRLTLFDNYGYAKSNGFKDFGTSVDNGTFLGHVTSSGLKFKAYQRLVEQKASIIHRDFSDLNDTGFKDIGRLSTPNGSKYQADFRLLKEIPTAKTYRQWFPSESSLKTSDRVDLMK